MRLTDAGSAGWSWQVGVKTAWNRAAVHGNVVTMRLLFAFIWMLSAVSLAGCGPATDRCDCLVCERAVQLEVVDARGNAVSDFWVEAIVNGERVGQPEECDVAVREQNRCSFGFVVGTYHVVVSAPGFETREVMVRVADQSGGAACCTACLRGKEITLALTSTESAP